MLEGEGGEEVAPGGEDEKDGDRPQVVEEGDASAGLFAGPRPQVLGQLGEGMVGEGDQIEGDEHGGEVFLAVTEIVLEVVALGLERIKALVLDLPSGTAAGGEFDDSAAIHRQVGDEAVSVGDLALRVGDLDREPVDVHGVLAVAQGQVAQPSVGIAKARFPTLERLDVLARFDAGKIFRQRRVGGRFADE